MKAQYLTNSFLCIMNMSNKFSFLSLIPTATRASQNKQHSSQRCLEAVIYFHFFHHTICFTAQIWWRPYVCSSSTHLLLPAEASALFLVLTVASVFTREQSPSCGPSTGPDFIPFGHTDISLGSWQVCSCKKTWRPSLYYFSKLKLRR